MRVSEKIKTRLEELTQKVRGGESLTSKERVEAVTLGCWDKPLRGVPCLYGETQTGKTYFGLDLLKQYVERIVSVNPQLDLPEDIGGFPRARRGVIYYTQPSVIPAELFEEHAPTWGVFVDEMDKALAETLSALLTFFSPIERRIRQYRFSAEIPQIVAMNEPQTPLPDPLLARMLMISWPPRGFKYHKEIPSLKGLKAVLEVTPTSVPPFPARPHTVGNVIRLSEWYDFPLFWLDSEVKLMVVEGLFPTAQVKEILLKLEEAVGLDPVGWIKAASPLSIAKNFLLVAHQSSPEQIHEMFQEMVKRTTAEPDGELAKIFEELVDLNYPAYIGSNDETIKRVQKEWEGVFKAKFPQIADPTPTPKVPKRTTKKQ